MGQDVVGIPSADVIEMIGSKRPIKVGFTVASDGMEHLATTGKPQSGKKSDSFERRGTTSMASAPSSRGRDFLSFVKRSSKAADELLTAAVLRDRQQAVVGAILPDLEQVI